MNVKRTVKGYASAGFAGILIEDQARRSNPTFVSTHPFCATRAIVLLMDVIVYEFMAALCRSWPRQVWPKSCGHVAGKRVVPRDEAIARVTAAADAR